MPAVRRTSSAFVMVALLAAGPHLFADSPSFQDVRQRLVEMWPRSGAVFAEYSNLVVRGPAGSLHLGYDFATGAWYRYAAEMNQTVGMTPDGRQYVGEPGSGLEFVDPPQTGFDSVLDPYFPALMLKDLLQRTEAQGEIRAQPDGTLELDFALPRGSRRFRVAELPEPELARWGGPERIARRVTLSLAPDLRVLRWEADDLTGANPRRRTFQTSPESPPGFQVSAREPEGDLDIRLVSLRVVDGRATEEFTLDAVDARQVAWRSQVRRITPVGASNAVSGTVTPITSGTRSPSARTWLFGAAVAALVGALALYALRRRSRS